MKSIKVIGFDLAINHGAAVELTDGEPTWWAFYTDIAGVVDRAGVEIATRLDLPKAKAGEKLDRHQVGMLRLAQVEHWIDKTVLVPRAPDYAGVEDYAIRQEQGAHYMGEIGGIARILLWFRGIPFRLSDPISTKMFITHDGTAQKDAVERAIEERFPGMPWGDYNAPKPPKAAKQNRQTSEDLADAAAIAQLVWTEYRLRHGLIRTQDLHEKEVRVFNRVTKTYPTSLLDREWIHNPKGAPAPHANLRTRMEARIRELDSKGATVAAKLLKDILADGT